MHYSNYYTFPCAGVVYNITRYLEFHPGGKSEVMKAAGIDCTFLFNQVQLIAIAVSCNTIHAAITRFIFAGSLSCQPIFNAGYFQSWYFKNIWSTVIKFVYI